MNKNRSNKNNNSKNNNNNNNHENNNSNNNHHHNHHHHHHHHHHNIIIINETEEIPRENENVTAEEAVELDEETKELKDEILRKILQIKFANTEDRERLSKIRTDKKV